MSCLSGESQALEARPIRHNRPRRSKYAQVSALPGLRQVGKAPEQDRGRSRLLLHKVSGRQFRESQIKKEEKHASNTDHTTNPG